MNIQHIRQYYNQEILAEALRRFGFQSQPLEELEGSAYVYEGLRDGLPCILKIVPGKHNTRQLLAGASEEQMLGEIDFVLYLAAHGVKLAMPLRSVHGKWVESIPVTDTTCFLVYGFEKAPGFMFPDEDEVHFPEPILTEWGRLQAVLHNLAEAYQPSQPAYRRVEWDQDDRLDHPALIPADQPLVHQRFAETLAEMHALPKDPAVYGLTHGDFHHGNFFVEDGQIILFDFDAAQYFWFAGEISIPLYNCLPLPRADTLKRRTYALGFLYHFLKGYQQERVIEACWLEKLPLFLKFQELIDYAYKYKYWDLAQLSPRKQHVLQEFRTRIEENISVVSFEQGDLENLLIKFNSGELQ